MSRKTFTWEDGKRKSVDVSKLAEGHIFLGDSLVVLYSGNDCFFDDIRLMLVPAGIILATFHSRDDAIGAALSLYDRQSIDWNKLNRNLQGLMFEVPDDADSEAYQKAIRDAWEMTFGHKAGRFYFTLGYTVANWNGWSPGFDDRPR